MNATREVAARRARLVTRPSWPGRALTKTIGMVEVRTFRRERRSVAACPRSHRLAVNASRAPMQASVGRTSAQRYSIATFCPGASSESEMDGIFASLVQLHAGALVVSPNAFFASRRDQTVALTTRHAVPAIYTGREFPAAAA